MKTKKWQDFYGINVCVEDIADTLYEMIKEHPDGACLRLGMFPAQIMECFTNGLKERIPENYIIAGTTETARGKDTIQEIEHAVCCKILELATNEGYCIV